MVEEEPLLLGVLSYGSSVSEIKHNIANSADDLKILMGEKVHVQKVNLKIFFAVYFF